jgi:NADH dehydrogenase
MGNVVKGIDVSSVLRGNRIAVDEFCKVKNYQNVFAVGDVACMILPDYPRGHAMVAPVAIQQGHLLAKNLLNLLQNKPLKAFKYLDKGSMATVGRNRAVVEAGAFKTQGLIAWFMWMAVHLMTLVGFRNKVVTFFNWMWSYLNYDRGIRLIIRPYERHLNDEQ